MLTTNHILAKPHANERSRIMKKIVLLSMILLLVGVSGTAFAAAVGYTTDSLSLGTAGDLPLVVKTSKNVAMRIDVAAATSPDPAVNYVMTAYHTTGSRTFGTSNQDQKLYYIEATGSLTAPAVSTSTTTPPAWPATWLPL